MASDQLNTAFDIAEDFVAPRWAYDVTEQQTFDDLNCFGSHHMPMAWATVMRFRRSVFVEQIFEIMRNINKTDGVSMLLVEQNASLALNLADHAYLLETGNVVLSGPAEDIRADESVRRTYLGY